MATTSVSGPRIMTIRCQTGPNSISVAESMSQSLRILPLMAASARTVFSGRRKFVLNQFRKDLAALRVVSRCQQGASQQMSAVANAGNVDDGFHKGLKLLGKGPAWGRLPADQCLRALPRRRWTRHSATSDKWFAWRLWRVWKADPG